MPDSSPSTSTTELDLDTSSENIGMVSLNTNFLCFKKTRTGPFGHIFLIIRPLP